MLFLVASSNQYGGMTLDFLEVDAVGTAGGLLCIWDPKIFKLEETCGSRNFIIMKGILAQSFPGVLVNVYSP